jgi:cytochrome c
MCKWDRQKADGGRRKGPRFRRGVAAALFLVPLACLPADRYPGVGRAATPAEIAAWDIDVRPDFKGLPAGSGSVARGQQVWESKCAGCHGTFGESNEVFAPIVGGTTAEDIRTGRVKSLVTGDTGRTTLMKLSSISTLWDYVRRAMPWDKPKSLTVEEVYAVVAYILNLGDIVPSDFVLSDRNIAEVQGKLPNRNGMTREHGLWDVNGKGDVANVACMKDCAADVRLASAMPDYAKGSHGNLAEQNRRVGAGTAKVAAARAEKAPESNRNVELARTNGCMACHGVDKKVIGPAFREVATRYKGQAGAEPKLLEKLKYGGKGTWGQIPMPGNPDVPEADARAIVRWILSGAL